MVSKNYGMLIEEHKCLIGNKILGLKWDTFEDNFILDFNEIRERFDVIPTKRKVIKATALNPIAVQMKTFFQKLCSAKYDWDDLIAKDYLEEWNELVKSLSAIEFISVPRLCCSHNPIVSIELHGFCVNESIRVFCVFTFCPQVQICQSGVSYFQVADCTLTQAKYPKIRVAIFLVISSSV